MYNFKYGTKLSEFVTDIVEKSTSKFIGLPADLNQVKNQIATQLNVISNGGINSSDIEVNVDPKGPTKFNIDIKINYENTKAKVAIDPEKEKTHDWFAYYKEGVSYCKKCGMNRLKMNIRGVNRITEISLADYNLSCTEMDIKDVIE